MPQCEANFRARSRETWVAETEKKKMSRLQELIFPFASIFEEAIIRHAETFLRGAK